MKTEENLKNAFQVVRQTFIELGDLFQDFEAELEENGLVSLQTGNEIGTQLSKSLKHADRWLFKYIARYYGEPNKNEKRKWYSGATMIHYGQDRIPIVPRFLIGILKKNKPLSQQYEPWWISSMYRSDYGRKITDENGKSVETIFDNKWHKVIHVSEGGKGSEKWYDAGYIYSVKLTDIKNKQDVAVLAKELSDKFNKLNE